MTMKFLLHLCLVYLLTLFWASLSSDQLCLVSAQDGLVLGVQTTANISAQVVHSTDSDEKLMASAQSSSYKDSNVVEEIHSSFEELSVAPDESKVKERLQADPTVHFDHGHVNIATELSESGQPEVVYTLVDSGPELQHPVGPGIHPENSTGPVTIPLTLSDALHNDTQYIVRAEPRHDSQPPTSVSLQEPEGVVEGELVVSNVTEESNDTVVTPLVPPPQEDIPSFSEWAQKQLAEAEKRRGENATGGGTVSTQLKVRHSKNYASPDCGAKVVGANPEAVSASSVLSPSRDEYLLNTCNARIWFIVELCEAIQPKKVEIANFELFSSSPQEFSVWLSDRYPTRDWVLLGRLGAQDSRSVQTFNLSTTDATAAHFGKYVKVEIHSHYGHEHYCPVSLFRVYGTSEIEVLDTVEEGHHQPPADEDDDDIPLGEGGDTPKNLFGSARDAVLSIVKKAAEALGKSAEEGGRGNSSSHRCVNTSTASEPCVTPSHIAVCVNCSDHFYNRMYDLLSCRSRGLGELLESQFVRRAVAGSEECAARGLDLREGAPYPAPPPHRPRPIHYLQAFLPPETLAALCNLLAVAQKKVVLNTSYEQVLPDNITVSSLSVEEDTLTLALPDVALVPSDQLETTRVPAPLIRPSPTLQPDNVTSAEVNVTVSPVELDPTAVNNTNNVTASVGVDRVTENLTLVVEDAGSLDSLFSELEQAVVPRKNPAPQKESVFVRLANRIKALERNMSLSGQYLEELSRRYKRQVEEMQKALAAAGERDQTRAEQVLQLKEQVEALTLAVTGLLEERDSWQHKASVMTQHGVLVVVEVVVFAAVLYLCRWLPDVQGAGRKLSVAWPRAVGRVTRRKSVDDTILRTQPHARARRPSEEALLIAGSTHRELLIPQQERRKLSKGETRRQRKKRKRDVVQQTEREEKPSLLDKNNLESVRPWWEDEAYVVPLPPPLPPRTDDVVAAPRFVQTAVAQRQERLARSSSETTDNNTKAFLPIKKTGPFKKIVKKFF